jgi:hypothetical protein
MNLLTATEMAESLGIDPKTFWRWREAGSIRVKGGDEKHPLFDLADGVAIMVEKRRKKQGAKYTEEMFLQRWKSKVKASQQSLDHHKEVYLDYSELVGLWNSIIGRATTEIGKLPATIARLAEGVEDIATVSEIVRTQVHATLNTLSASNENEYIDGLPEEVEEASIEAPENADISDLIEIERTLQNNLVSDLNERRADVADGKLLDVNLAEQSMTQMVGIARVKLLALSAGFARLLSAQSRSDIVSILTDELEHITAELKPELPAGLVDAGVAFAQDGDSEE